MTELDKITAAMQNDEQNEEENEMDSTSIIETMRADIIAHTERSAWSKGVTEYALELLDSLAEGIEGGYYYADDIAAPRVLEKNLLNGAADWSAYSWGGCSLIYDADIAERLCTPSELKKTRNGERKPNAREEWLDCQARALSQGGVARHERRQEGDRGRVKRPALMRPLCRLQARINAEQRGKNDNDRRKRP